jgi:sugar/nucleoside kinase (ribokinase family)
MPEILCLGLVVADVLGRPIRRLPRPGTLETCDFMGLYPGGCAVNTGSALAKIGVQCSLVGAVGMDGFGDYLFSELAKRGLGLQGLRRLAGVATSASMVIVNPHGERAFIHHVGANAKLSEKHLDWAAIKRHKILHIGGSFLMPALDGAPLARVLKRARSLGLKTSLDTVYNPKLNWAKVLKPCLPHVDYFLPSFEEARQILGSLSPLAMGRRFMAEGAGAVAIKMGARGSFVYDGAWGQQIPAFKVHVVDSTGAGDAFCAGFLAGVLKGLSLEASAKLGNALGSACCTRAGAYDGIPDRRAVRKFLKD